MNDEKIYKFNFDIELVEKLREVVNDKLDFTFKAEHIPNDLRLSESFLSWNRICAILDRLEDTINYLNSIELGHCQIKRSAFDFYDFINNACIIVDCIEIMSFHIFKLDDEELKSIKSSNDVFGCKMDIDATDYKFFKYIRTLCSIHPISTSGLRHPYLKDSKFHVCPFVTWDTTIGNNTGDLTAMIYTSNNQDSDILLPLYINEFENYINKWINLIPKIINVIYENSNMRYDKLKNEKMKDKSEFTTIVEYIQYLKDECNKRYSSYQDYIFERYIKIFNIKLTDKRNESKLEKYKNAIEYSLGFLHQSLQSMSFNSFETTGIKYPDPSLESDLFTELEHCRAQNGAFDGYSYNIAKANTIDTPYDFGEYIHARKMIDEISNIINKYVYFTNTEPSDETVILINLALYLDSLTQDCLINKNIPNDLKYREKLLINRK